jgi:hypothetical protein
MLLWPEIYSGQEAPMLLTPLDALTNITKTQPPHKCP